MNTPARALVAVLFLSWGAALANAQEVTWIETRFHRVHLINGNFIDGNVLAVRDSDIRLKLQVGEMIIRKDSIDRIELVKIKSVQEKPKLDPPLKKSAPASNATPISRLKAAPTFAPAPADDALIENVSKLMSRLKIAKPDQRESLIGQMADLANAGPYLASLLPTVDEDSGYMIRSALMRSKDPLAVPYLVRALESDRQIVVINTLGLLGLLGSVDNSSSIRPFLGSAPPAVKATAIESLQQLGDAGSLQGIADLMGDNNDMVRLAAINASLELGRIHNRMDIAMDGVRRNLLGSQGKVAKELLYAVSRAKMTELWSQVLPFLRDDDPLLRKTAAVVLQTIAVPEAVDAVQQRLEQEEDVKTLIELAKAAAKLKSPATIPVLIRLVGHQSEDVVQASGAALTLMTRQRFGTNQKGWAEWWERNKGN